MSEEKEQITVNHFRAVQIGLDAYVESRLGEEDDSNYMTFALISRFRSAFENCSGLSEMLHAALRDESPTLERMHDVRMSIYRALGAPGDWGYGTQIGSALQKLYQAGGRS